MLSGIKEDIVLDEYTENASYSFILETDGLALFENENGRYLAVNENSETAGMVAGFRQWFIIQHWDELEATVQPKPFVTVVSIDIPIGGSL